MIPDYRVLFSGKPEVAMKRILDFIQNNNIDINKITDERKFTLLLTSIEMGKRYGPITKKLVELGADVNGTKKHFAYPLEEAILNSNLDAVKTLISSPKLRYNRKYDNSLAYATYKGFTDIVKLLLENGVPISKMYRGASPLLWAAQEGHIEVVELLCSYGADVNCMELESGFTPLYKAAANGYYEIVKILLHQSADVNCRSKNGTSAIQIASAWEHYEVMELLISAGADTNLVDNEGRTALFYARIRDKDKLCKYLISKGASKNLVDKHGISYEDLKEDHVRFKLYNELYG